LAHGSIESRAGNFHVFRGDAETEEFAKVWVREIDVRVSGGLGGVRGMTPIEPHMEKISGISRRRWGRGVDRVAEVRVPSGFVFGGGATSCER
jgi:hypothetical protein